MKITATDIVRQAERNARIHGLMLECLPNMELQLKDACLRNVDLFHKTDTTVPCLEYCEAEDRIVLYLGGLDYSLPVAQLCCELVNGSEPNDRQSIIDAMFAALQKTIGGKYLLKL